MRFAIGSFAFAFGYVLIYYGIGMYQNYNPNASGPTSTVGFYTLSQLLGFKADPKSTKQPSLPFKTGTTVTGASPSSNTQGGGVQLV